MIDMRAIMERCANIYGAASCLHFLNDQESIYTIRPHEQHAELDMLWTMMPLSPKPVSINPLLFTCSFLLLEVYVPWEGTGRGLAEDCTALLGGMTYESLNGSALANRGLH